MNFSVAVGCSSEIVVSGVGVACGEHPMKESTKKHRIVVSAARRENVFSMESIV
jgi:hypothetical protein